MPLPDRKRNEKLTQLLKNEEFQIIAANFVAGVILSDDTVIKRILSDDRHPHFIRMMELLMERGYGKVPTEIKGELAHMPVVALPAKEPIPDADFSPVEGSGPAAAAVGAPSGDPLPQLPDVSGSSPGLPVHEAGSSADLPALRDGAGPSSAEAPERGDADPGVA